MLFIFVTSSVEYYKFVQDICYRRSVHLKKNIEYILTDVIRSVVRDYFYIKRADGGNTTKGCIY